MIFFRDFFVVIASAVIVLAWRTVTDRRKKKKKKKESQKIDDLPVLATLPVWYFSDAFQQS